MKMKRPVLITTGSILAIFSLISIYIVGLLLSTGTNFLGLKNEIKLGNEPIPGLSEKEEITIKLKKGTSHIIIANENGEMTLISPTKAFPYDKKELHQSHSQEIMNGLMQIITGTEDANASHCADNHRQCSGTYIDGRGFSRPYCWCL